MKLRFKGKKSRVVMVKKPTYFYVSLEPGQEVEVQDQIAYQLLATHPDLLEQATDKAMGRSPRDKMVHSEETK